MAPAETNNESPAGPITVADADAGMRLDRLLTTNHAGLSRSRIQALIASGDATVNGRVLSDAGYRVKPGDVVSLAVPPPAAAQPEGEAIPLSVVYEDAALIVIDKPPGLVVHPAAGHETGTLVNALIAHCGDSLSGIGGVKRPGIVHRLDKDTSGLLVVAKSDEAHQGLTQQFAAHGRDGRLQRQYVALVWGALPAATGVIDAPLARSQLNRTKMTALDPASRVKVVLGGGLSYDGDDDDEPGRAARAAREAVTHYAVAEVFHSQGRDGKAGAPLASLIRVELETGRTHQIRVHMAHIGHPVLGDTTYGAGFKASERRLSEPQYQALSRLGRQALHAAVLGFEHPVTGAKMRFESPVPPDMSRLIETLRGAPVKPPARKRSVASKARKAL